jgi:LmbE family N-acetylglucosaminyl deacetylase
VATPADPPVERALVVTAHPDDVDFGAAGTVASWTAAGTVVTYCLVTSGDAGGFDDTPREEMAALREAEQRDAAAAVGVSDLVFLGHRDGAVTVTPELRRDIARVVRRVRPQRVLTQSPEWFWERLGASHPDHRATGEAALVAVYPDARNPFAYPELLADEGLEPWTVAEVWMMAGPSERLNRYVDVTDKLGRKLAALRAHKSQTAHMDDLEKILTTWMGTQAQLAGFEPGRLAEAYHVIDSQG